MKKLPSSVNIFGRKIKVKQGKNLAYEGQLILGLCDYSKNMIYIEANQTEQSKIETLHHEIVHYFLIMTGMDQRLAESEIEMYCQLIANLIKDLDKI